MAVNMWKNSLKNVESDKNKFFYETLLDFFLQRNGKYFLNKPRRKGFSVKLIMFQQTWLINKVEELTAGLRTETHLFDTTKILQDSPHLRSTLLYQLFIYRRLAA